MPRSKVRIAVLVVVGALAALVPPSAIADCDGPNALFREAAPTAERVIVGEVISTRPADWDAGDSSSSRFTVQGWSILGGVRRETIDVDDLLSAACGGVLIARPGDVVALAFGGTAFSTRERVNAIAWIEDVPPVREWLERITLAEVFSLVGVPAQQLPPTDPEAAKPNAPPPWIVLGAAIAGLLFGGAHYARGRGSTLRAIPPGRG
jgi:hypothetical protein